MIEDEMKPEVGDLVSYGTATYGPHGLVAEAPRGIVRKVYKNGNIEVRPNDGSPIQKLLPLEFFVLSKAG